MADFRHPAFARDHGVPAGRGVFLQLEECPTQRIHRDMVKERRETRLWFPLYKLLYPPNHRHDGWTGAAFGLNESLGIPIVTVCGAQWPWRTGT